MYISIASLEEQLSACSERGMIKSVVYNSNIEQTTSG